MASPPQSETWKSAMEYKAIVVMSNSVLKIVMREERNKLSLIFATGIRLAHLPKDNFSINFQLITYGSIVNIQKFYYDS